MDTPVLRPIVELGRQAISLRVGFLEVSDQLLHTAPRRRDEIDGISSWVLFPLFLKYLSVEDPSLIQFKPLAAGGENSAGAKVEDHDEVLRSEIGMLLHR